MSFERFAARSLLPLLLVALVAVGYLTFGTVKTIKLDTTTAVRPAEESAFPPLGTSRLALGERFDALADLDRDQLAVGFVRVGRFGEAWPARVVEVRSELGGISFTRRNGTTHSYGEFAGYTLKIVRLEGGAGECIAVYRSQSKNT